MTDDALSELAEALDDACRANGNVSAERAAFFNDGAWCPLGALIGTRTRKLPGAEWISRRLGIPLAVSRAFIGGFDGDVPPNAMYLLFSDWPRRPDRGDVVRAFELGRLFRELYP